jgi:UDP-N-acetylmuramoyl-L-alanyl-D-glutamate--2,6-diaminopimelate ligase
VLRALSELTKDNHLITVFGCGGDRDSGKRPLMAQAAAEFSDVVLITSDNPRTEDPLKIMAQIKSGIPADFSGEILVESDRRKALSLALQTAREGDVILVAGKGHEDYQIIGNQKFSFSDVKVVGELLGNG